MSIFHVNFPGCTYYRELRGLHCMSGWGLFALQISGFRIVPVGCNPCDLPWIFMRRWCQFCRIFSGPFCRLKVWFISGRRSWIGDQGSKQPVWGWFFLFNDTLLGTSPQKPNQRSPGNFESIFRKNLRLGKVVFGYVIVSSFPWRVLNAAIVVIYCCLSIRFDGIYQEKYGYSMAMLVYQRVNPTPDTLTQLRILVPFVLFGILG